MERNTEREREWEPRKKWDFARQESYKKKEISAWKVDYMLNEKERIDNDGCGVHV